MVRTLIPRCCESETDFSAIAFLLKSSESDNQFHEWPSPDEMLMQLEVPSVDKERDICLWEYSNSQLVAIAGLMIPETGESIAGIFWFRVHPLAKGNNLEAQILEWGEKRMEEVGRERKIKVKVLCGTHGDNIESISLLENHGFKIERYFLTMERALAPAIPVAQLPEGFTLKHIAHEADAPAWAEMFNQAFREHWNH